MKHLFPLLPIFLALVAASACGDDDGGGGGPGATQTAAPTSRVVPDERPEGQFTMCVQALRGLEGLQDEGMTRLKEALAGAQADGRWGRYFPSSEAPVVDAGCPQEPAVPATNFVEKPGYYRVFAFVVEQVPFNPLFAQESVRTESGAGVEETAGMFVTPLDLCDADKLVQMLKTAVKFDHTLNRTPTPGPDETARPEVTPCLDG